MVGLGDRDKEWASLSRVFSTKAAAVAAAKALGQAVESGEPGRWHVPGTDRSVLARPVPGTDETVHGAVLWHGPADETPTRWPRAAGFDWSSDTREVGFTPQLRGILGSDGDRTSYTGPEAFRWVVDFDDGALGFVGTTLQRSPDNRWIGSVTLRTQDGPLPVRSAMRSMASPNETYWRGIAFESMRDVPAPTPSVAGLALEALSRTSDTAIALVDLEKVRIVQWVTDPIAGIAWKGVVDQRDTPHPDDVDRIAASIRTLYRGATESAVPGVRLRRIDSGWTVVDVRATVLSVPDAPTLLLAEFRTVGHSDEPDPVPPTDTGYRT